MNGPLLLLLVAPALATAILIGVLKRTPLAGTLSDRPNERSLHERPTPRIGGVALVPVALAAMLACSPTAHGAVAACAIALWAISLADDARSLPIQVRLPAHATAALLVVLSLPASAHPLAWALLGFPAIVWVTNLFNFMDGADGLAGGMATIGFAALAWAALDAGAWPLACACMALASASVGFLAHNFPPAHVFLGDAGSIPLGFLAGALGYAGIVQGAWSAWVPLLVFSPFIVDATVTLLRRLAARERIWIAHRQHAYQRLVLAGWSRRRVATCAYALMLAAAASAVWMRPQGAMLQCGIILAWAALYAGLLAAVERRAPRLGATPRSANPGSGQG